MTLSDNLPRVLSELIAIDSVNPSADPAGGGEGALVEYIESVCRGLGLATERREVLPGRPNLLAHLEAPNARGRLLFIAHTDTVPAGDMPQPFTPRIEHGRMMGRGACDDKGPLVAMLAAMERLVAQRRELRVHVTFAAVIDEEWASTGAKALAAMGVQADGAIVAEGTELSPVIAHRGSARLKLKVLGKAAHSARPELGHNAITDAAEVIRHLNLNYAPTLISRRHSYAGSPSLAVTRIQGGLSGNIIPPECALTLNRRFLPGETQASVCAEIDAALSDLQRARPELKCAALEIEDWDGALDTPPEAGIARAALQAVRQVTDRGELSGAPWCSDAPVLAQAGIPCVVLGPDSVAEQGHTNHESVSLEQVALAARVYEALALGFGDYL